MPRRGSVTAAKATATGTTANPPNAQVDSDDDFFDGTILASRKRKGPSNPFESDEDVPRIPNTTYRFNDTPQRSERELSSSPPPTVSDLPAPQIEPMHQALNPFHLRDDEYMMVEDEFLQTAKLFTRHLHLAEYERLKSLVRCKINNGQEITRPVLANAKVPEERKRKMRAERTKKAQRDALRSVMEEEEEEGDEDAGVRKDGRKELLRSGGSGKESMKTKTEMDTASDSSDLDATPKPHPPKRTHPAPQPDAPPSSPPDSAPMFLKSALPASKSKPSTTASFTSRYNTTTTTSIAAKTSTTSPSSLRPRFKATSLFNAPPTSKPPSPSPSCLPSNPAPHTHTSPPTTTNPTTKHPRKRHRAGRSLSALLDDDFDFPPPGGPSTPNPPSKNPPPTHPQLTTSTPFPSLSTSTGSAWSRSQILQERRHTAASAASTEHTAAHRGREKRKEKGGGAEGAEGGRRESITLDDIPTFLF